MRLAALVVLSLASTALVHCTARQGDPLVPPDASAVGAGQRLREVRDPASPTRPGTGATIGVSGVVVSAVDTFDETHDGKSLGGVFLQDVGQPMAYGGLGTFGMTFVPASLRVVPGDVLDVRGEYQENAAIGTAVFPAGTYLPQLFRPTGTFRFDGPAPEPVEVPLDDLYSFDRGRKWIGMLVRVSDVHVKRLVEDRGRVSGALYRADRTDGGVSNDQPTLVNELYDLKVDDLAGPTTFKSVTGVVTFFFNLHLAPRGPSDLVR